MRVHLDVLCGMADKAAVQCRHGQRPTSNDVTELTYPLQRARQFAYQYRSYAERESYRRFVAALDRYQALVEAIDAARGDEARWAAERARSRRHKCGAWRAAASRRARRARREKASVSRRRSTGRRARTHDQRPSAKIEAPVAAAGQPPRG